MLRHVKIVCTLGPATASADMIEALVSAGEKAKAEELVKQLKEKYPDFDAKKYIDQQQAKEGR